jgi:nicotinate-nucleotide adenylyltransferase
MGRKDVSLLEVPAMAISSTDCRARVAAGDPVWYLVPDGVVQYIAKYGLYDDDPDPVADPAAADGIEAENEAARYSRAAPVNEHASTE